MSYWSAVAIIFPIIFLAFKYPEAMGTYLPQWLWPGTQRNEEPRVMLDPSSAEAPGINIEVEHSAKIPEQDGSDGTPKAAAVTPKENVPSFSLTEHEDEKEESGQAKKQSLSMEDEEDSRNMSPEVTSMFPAPNSAQRVGGGAFARKPSAGLMAPPARVPSSHTNLGSRGLSAGPLPNRGPPTNNHRNAVNRTLGPAGIASTPNARGRVTLSPGHSPMDWAALTKSSNVSGVSTFQRVTPSQLRTMTGRKGKPAWSSWQGKVYNITPYLPFHPGGESELMKAAGRDGTKLFMDVHPWVNWENMLGNCLVGIMVPEDYGKSELEDMD